MVTTTALGGNTVSAIETYVNNAYDTWDVPPSAVLLLGDYSTGTNGIISQFYTHPAGYPDFVSDNRFADVTGDNLPEIAFARITANDASQLQVMISKFLKYERNPPTDYNFYDHPITALGWQTERWFQLCSEIVGGYFRNELGKNPVRINAIYSGTPGTVWSTATNTSTVVSYFGPSGLGYIPATPAELGGWSGGTAAQVVNAINNGSFLLQHRDHGFYDGWGEPAFTSTNISSLTNINNKLPYVFSINCQTGAFHRTAECFTEKFHRYTYGGQNSGALGVLAATEVSYSFVNDTYLWGVMDNLFPDFMPAQSTTFPVNYVMPAFGNAAGKIFLYQSSWPYNSGDKLITYRLFHHHGDAFMTLYTEVPQNLTVSHNPTLPAGAATFSVSANAGSLIALTVNGEILGTATGTGSPVVISIPAQSPGAVVVVTVTKQNYFRHSSNVNVISTGLYAEFTANNTTPYVDGAVNFTDLSYGSPTSWAWSFSPATVTYVGGTTSASQHPQVQFNAAGYYTVTLTASNAGGSDSETKTNYILASIAPPVANFSANTTSPIVGQTVTFTDLSANTPTSWNWSFSPATVTYVGGTSSTSKNPQVQFNAGGYYTVTLTATNAGGSDGESKTNYIFAIAPPVANFSSSTTTPFIGQTVTFTDLSVNNPTSWSWSFSPATVIYVGGTSSASQNPQVQFNVAGNYNVTLTAANSAGSDGETKTNYILAYVPAPVANFSASMSMPFIGQTVTFTDLSTNLPTSWAWSFSPATVTYVGGTASGSQNPQVQFNAAGYYSVTLTATNAGGSDGETKTNYINALDNPPVATLKLGTLTNPAPGSVLVPVTLEAINNPAAGNNLISSYNWFIAYDATRLYNGEPAAPVNLTNYNSQFPSINYITNIIGNYPSPGWNTLAILYTSDVSSSGSVGMKFFDIVFNYTPGTTVCPNLYWTSTEITGTNLADDLGNEFLLTLINGCVWSQPPVADFIASTTTPLVGATVNFTDLSTNYPTSWLWTFTPSSVTYVNGTNATSQNPQVKFNTSGAYTVTLTSTNALGADSETKTNYISVQNAFIYLDLTVFLEGSFNGTGMTPYLNTILPYSQPYNTSPWNYPGTESVGAIPNGNVVDWILVELRDAANAASATSATIMARKAAFLLNNGKVVGLDGLSTLQFNNSLTQYLFVVIWHRNHLGVMSANYLTEAGGLYGYNFSTGATQAFGGSSAHKQIGPGIWGMFGGDGNKDGQITPTDKTPVWNSQSGTKGYLQSDYNLDTQSNNKDKNNIWAPNLGSGSQVLN